MVKSTGYRVLFVAGIIAVLSSWIMLDRKPVRSIENTSFTTGEYLEYKIHVGLINAASGEMLIHDKIYDFNGRPCFKAEVTGRTNGFFDWVIKVRDRWGVLLDTSAILPLKSYRYIEEGKYRKNEIVYFDHDRDTAIVHFLHKKTKAFVDQKEYSIEHFSQGLISGYYYLRTMDLNHVNYGDTLNINGFFDKEKYKFELVYLGIQKVKTKIGDYKAHVLSPRMPESSIFDGENSVKIWLSADENKTPLKAKAKMFIGALEVDIASAKGLRKH